MMNPERKNCVKSISLPTDGKGVVIKDQVDILASTVPPVVSKDTATQYAQIVYATKVTEKDTIGWTGDLLAVPSAKEGTT